MGHGWYSSSVLLDDNLSAIDCFDLSQRRPPSDTMSQFIAWTINSIMCVCGHWLCCVLSDGCSMLASLARLDGRLLVRLLLAGSSRRGGGGALLRDGRHPAGAAVPADAGRGPQRGHLRHGTLQVGTGGRSPQGTAWVSGRLPLERVAQGVQSNPGKGIICHIVTYEC